MEVPGSYSFANKILVYDGYEIGPIENNYQVLNIVLVLAAVEFLRKNGTILQKDAIIRAIENTSLPGRFSKVTDKLIVDGAHNIPGIRALMENLRELDDPLVVFNSFQDKNYLEMYDLLQEGNYRVVVYYDDHPRSIRPGAIDGDSISSLQELENLVEHNEMTVVCGSLHFALKIYSHFKKLG